MPATSPSCRSCSCVCADCADRPAEGPLRSEGHQESQLLLKEAAARSDGTDDAQRATNEAASIELIGEQGPIQQDESWPAVDASAGGPELWRAARLPGCCLLHVTGDVQDMLREFATMQPRGQG